MKTLFRRIVPRWLMLIMGVVLITLAGCDIGNIIEDDNAGGNATASESFSLTVQVARQNRIELRGINGNVELTGVPNAPAVQIWGERRVTSRSTADARAYLENLQVRVVDSQSEVIVETVQPEDNHGRELEVEYHLHVPSTWQAVIGNINGNVAVDSLAQTAAIVLTNGNVMARAITGDVSASLTNGNVVLEEITGNVGVALVNGNFNARVTLPPAGTCDVNTVNGVMALQIPRDTSAEFSAALSNGTISLSDLILQNASSSRTSLRGKLGDGAGKITLTAVNGDIHVRGF